MLKNVFIILIIKCVFIFFLDKMPSLLKQDWNVLMYQFTYDSEIEYMVAWWDMTMYCGVHQDLATQEYERCIKKTNAEYFDRLARDFVYID